MESMKSRGVFVKVDASIDEQGGGEKKEGVVG